MRPPKYRADALRIVAVWSLSALASFSAPPPSIRVATFNTSLNRGDTGSELITLLSNTSSVAARNTAEIIQRVRPDVLLLNEFDYKETQPNEGVRLFQQNYLSIAQAADTNPLAYAYTFTSPVNTGVFSGFDLDNSGTATSSEGSQAYANDSLGFGWWRGQYGMAVLSRFPIQTANVRTFQRFLWKNLPGNVMPPGFYTTTEQNILRLSSKSHWDVPISLAPGATFHLLASHPTPPVFDGTEDRNGRRNHDEIRLWAEYLATQSFLRDDSGQPAALDPQARFLLLGDLNADPDEGDSYQNAVQQLLTHPRINASFAPQQSTTLDSTDTASFGLRADYVLPSKAGWKVLRGGIFWPKSGEPGANAITSSDHRLVWMDLAPVPNPASAVLNFRISQHSGLTTLQWNGLTEYNYSVETTDNPATNWTQTTQSPMEINGLWSYSIQTPPGKQLRKFYRIRMEWK